MDKASISKFKNYYSLFQILASLVSIVIVAANIYVAFKLAPVVENLNSITYRVQAIEDDRKVVPEYRAKVAVLEANYKGIDEHLKEIKDDVDTITSFLLRK